MEELAQLLMQRQISISSVESFTVGGFAKAIGSISGISAVYRGTLVSIRHVLKEMFCILMKKLSINLELFLKKWQV